MYDAENRQLSGGGAVNVYDGDGRRVKRTASGITSVYAYDAFGNLAVEYTSQALVTETKYVTTDALGSTRLVTNASGTMQECRDYLPFRERLTAGRQGCTNGDVIRQQITGAERDSETGLDFLQARYLSSMQGRFMSPDPGGAGSDPFDPQSWNGYTYALNNPLVNVDPSGMAAETACDLESTPTCSSLLSGHHDSTTVTDAWAWADTIWQAYGSSVNIVRNTELQVADQVLTAVNNFRSSPGCTGAVTALGTALGANFGGSAGGVAGGTTGFTLGSVVPVAGNAIGLAGGAALGSTAGALAGGTLGGAVGGFAGSIFCSGSAGSGGAGGSGRGSGGGNLKKLSPSEIQKLKAAGEDAEQIKKDIVGAGGSKYDLFKTSSGDIIVKLKSARERLNRRA